MYSGSKAPKAHNMIWIWGSACQQGHHGPSHVGTAPPRRALIHTISSIATRLWRPRMPYGGLLGSSWQSFTRSETDYRATDQRGGCGFGDAEPHRSLIELPSFESSDIAFV
ncbi:hypothetical protein FA15DRAFT_261303 [Coprinopsis marcescibilis]|uniref:Uncharacterized protein n=1 Tax=Coprinopsis marcescibilis TaxID=230819 RepID=A0A5C3KEA7_COPMA|nr:hypothetical protein FA15DRAFT_261303 [Coprinopsis marcescibilis]